MELSLGGINRYPVKSCRGEALTESTVHAWGLQGDRRWLVVDAHGVMITARECPRLLLIVPTVLANGGLNLVGPDGILISLEGPDPDRLIDVQIWTSRVAAAPLGALADQWLSEFLGRPARLVYLDDPTRRAPNPHFSKPGDRVSFADGYPLLVATTSSLTALNSMIAAGPRPGEGPVAMVRFRPNIVIDGGLAWDEDGWRVIRVGEAIFRAVKGCDRCVITTTDADTAVRGKEPITTLARHRRWDGAVWFGMNLIPDTPGAVIQVGDEVEVLESVPAPDGPPR